MGSAGDMGHDISARCAAIAAVLQCGMTRPAALPRAGQMAPKIQADVVRKSLGAEVRVPRLAQRLVIPVF